MASAQEHYSKIAALLGSGERAVLQSLYQGADVTKTVLTAGETQAVVAAAAALETGELQTETAGGGSMTLYEPYCPESRLVILGGGHIALPLCEFASKCGFAVTVVDDRPSFANKGRFPTARQVLCESFESCFDTLAINRFTFVVIITRGHRHDLTCLRQVLKRDTAYVGMIGSRRRVAAARQQILDEGFDPAKLEAVQSPIGLSIGAQSPEEISISILAQLIAFKRLQADAVWPELDLSVLTALSTEDVEPRVLVTVIDTKGSTPRDVGAKMLVWSDGRILGSIGGGCSESGVITRALDILRDGGWEQVRVDMTGQVAEDEGMVCGGVMQVLLERV